VTIIRFRKISDVFPAEDAVARFITVVAMMSNDWVRLMDDMLALDDHASDATARRIMSFRQQAALHDEAARFIADARRRFPQIDAFIKALDQEAQDECDQIMGGIDPKSPHYHGDWLTDHRNVTFHYPEMHPAKAAHGKEEISEALKAAAELEGTITFGQGLGSVRFGFADEVAVQWLPDLENEVHLIETLRESVMALARFAQRVIGAYLESRPDGTFTVEADSGSDASFEQTSPAPGEFRLQFDPAAIEALASRFSYSDDAAVVSSGAAAATRGYYTRDEFVIVCSWKTPRSKPLIAGVPPLDAESATGRALSATDERERLRALLDLPGVGVPTASALLHFAFPERYPILDVRALESLGVRGRSTYSMAFWLRYLDACRSLAATHDVSVRTLDKALWQHSKERTPQE
jgi:hypothetical protein